MNNDIKIRAYELYKLDWMASHGYTLHDIATVVAELSELGVSSDEVFSEFEQNGFAPGGDIYVCFDEFVVNEYQDMEHMKRLLSEDEYHLYLEDIGWNESENSAIRALRQNVQKEYVEWTENAQKHASPFETLVYTYVLRAICEGKLDKFASGLSTIKRPIEYLYKKIQCLPDFYYNSTVDSIEYFLEGKEIE